MTWTIETQLILTSFLLVLACFGWLREWFHSRLLQWNLWSKEHHPSEWPPTYCDKQVDKLIVQLDEMEDQ